MQPNTTSLHRLAALACFGLVGCGIVTIGPAHSGQADPEPSTASEAPGERASKDTEKEKTADPEDEPIPGGSCPSDLSVKPDRRTLASDSEVLKEMPPEVYFKMRWAPGHRTVAGADFFIDKDKALDRVIATEAKHPGLLPAGFRDALLARPRDKDLRLEAARCELTDVRTRRRASHDAAMAFLLGASPSLASRIMHRSASPPRSESHLKSCDSAKECGTGVQCQPVAKLCLDDATAPDLFVSDAELTIEDALTRALMKDYKGGGRKPDEAPRPGPAELDERALFYWAVTRTHRCGRQICKFTRYGADGGEIQLVRDDIRDRGTSYEVHDPVVEAKNERCRSATGSGSLSDCLQSCWARGTDLHGGDEDFVCKSRCAAHCE